MRLAEDDVVEIDGFSANGPARVGVGQCEQLVHQPFHTDGRAEELAVSGGTRDAAGCARLTSSLLRIPASGLRNSWLASATNSRS